MSGTNTGARAELIREVERELNRTDENATRPPTFADYVADVTRRLQHLVDGEPKHLILVPATFICEKCGTKVSQGSHGSWIDESGGDACEEGVHKADPSAPEDEPALKCPTCDTMNSITEVDVAERWNEGDVVFEDGKVVALNWSTGQGDFDHLRYQCGGCNNTVLLPKAVDPEKLPQDWS